jgi:outer membrane receptor for ferric coprogen and ferric-rhodotorulic acid
MLLLKKYDLQSTLSNEGSTRGRLSRGEGRDVHIRHPDVVVNPPQKSPFYGVLSCDLAV